MKRALPAGPTLAMALIVCSCLSATAACVPSDPVRSRRAAVERSLLPAILLAGRTRPQWMLEDRLQRYRVPGVGIAVINEGRIEWSAGYGVRRAGTTDAVSTSTLFQAASLSKPVTAAGALWLVQQGRLALDEDVNLRLRSWRIPASDHTVAQPVTLRWLLSHRAGVTVHGFAGYPSEAALPSLREILDGTGPANSPPVRVDAVPGGTYRYSGGGYEIAELLIGEATGMSFEGAMQDLMLRPLGMERSTFDQPLPASLRRDAAAGHRFDGTPVPGDWHTYPERAAAGLWSTPTDLARFAIGLMRAFQGEPGPLPVLNQETARSMLTEVADGAGLGLGVHGADDGFHFDHSGSNKGYRAYLVAFPHRRQGVVVMTNGDGGRDLVNEIVRSVARVYDWPGFSPVERAAASVDPSRLHSLAGAYRVRDHGFTLTVEHEHDHLLIRTPRGSWYTAYPATGTEYFAIEEASVFTFTVDDTGHHQLSVWGMIADRVPQASDEEPPPGTPVP